MDTQYDLMTLFTDGGGMMYMLILCSLVALGVIVSKMWMLWIAHRDSRKLLEEITELGMSGRLSDAIERAEGIRGPVAAILLAGLRRVRERRTGGVSGAKDIHKAISTTGVIELNFLERGLAVLGTIANVAPMLGFLGTVWGMIKAFEAIELAGQVEPGLVASGIKVALITTAAGLTIAIPVNIAYNFFVTRIDRLILDMDEGAQEVLKLIWSHEDSMKLRGTG